MSVFPEPPDVGRASCRTKPDLRLAESYVPALALCLKCLAYSTIAPIMLLMHWKVTVLSVALFCFVLYVDHLYLALPGAAFIDTTAVSLDVLGATVLVMVMSLLRPCTQQCQGVLAFWTLCSGCYQLAPFSVPRPLLHLLTLCLLLGFIYADLGQPLAGPLAPANSTALPHAAGFYARTSFYVSLAVVDVYLFRPLFQQENERVLLGKYGPVLLAAWPWCLGFWLLLAGVQGLKAAQTMRPSAKAPASSVQDLDVLEAFRLAKQQHMGTKGAI